MGWVLFRFLPFLDSHAISARCCLSTNTIYTIRLKKSHWKKSLSLHKRFEFLWQGTEREQVRVPLSDFIEQFVTGLSWRCPNAFIPVSQWTLIVQIRSKINFSNRSVWSVCREHIKLNIVSFDWSIGRVHSSTTAFLLGIVCAVKVLQQQKTPALITLCGCYSI